MHYANGKLAKVGDRVIGKNYQGDPVAGVVVFTQPGATTCNIRIAEVNSMTPTYNSNQFILLEDALANAEPAKAETEITDRDNSYPV